MKVREGVVANGSFHRDASKRKKQPLGHSPRLALLSRHFPTRKQKCSRLLPRHFFPCNFARSWIQIMSCGLKIFLLVGTMVRVGPAYCQNARRMCTRINKGELNEAEIMKNDIWKRISRFWRTAYYVFRIFFRRSFFFFSSLLLFLYMIIVIISLCRTYAGYACLQKGDRFINMDERGGATSEVGLVQLWFLRKIKTST